MRRFLISILILPLVFLSCEREAAPVLLPELSLSFDIEQSNSDRDFTATAGRIVSINKRSAWRGIYNDTVTLIREVMFEILLSNGDTLEFGLWMIKYENAQNVILEGDSLDAWDRHWDYRDFETESSNFYQGFREARVLVNNNVIWHEGTSDEFRFERIDRIRVPGGFRTYVELHFSGLAHGWYDPSGEYQEVYLLSHGVLKGVLE